MRVSYIFASSMKIEKLVVRAAYVSDASVWCHKKVMERF